MANAIVVLQEGQTYKIGNRIFEKNKPIAVTKQSEIEYFLTNSRFSVTVREDKPEVEPEVEAPEPEESAPAPRRGRPKKGKK